MYRYFENNLPNRWVYIKNTILCVVITIPKHLRFLKFTFHSELACPPLLLAIRSNLFQPEHFVNTTFGIAKRIGIERDFFATDTSYTFIHIA